MNVYLYKYNCKRWYGNESGLRNMYTESEMAIQDVTLNATKEAKLISGSNTCDISLILKYKLSIESTETYSNITKIPFIENKDIK